MSALLDGPLVAPGGGGASVTLASLGGLAAGPAATGDATLHWKCDETSGSTLANSGSGLSGNLAIAGAPVLGLPHPHGRGVRFSGLVADRAEGASGVALSTSAVTVLALVVASSLPGTYAQIVRRLRDAPGVATDCAASIALNNTGDGRIAVALHIGGALRGLTSALPYALRAGVPHLVGLRYDGAAFDLLLDGKVAATAAHTGALDWTAGVWELGVDRNFDAGGLSPWSGWIGDVRVHETALTDAEVRALYYQSVSRWSAP